MKRLGIFFFYEKNGDVDDFITYYLADLAQNLSELIVVCNGKLSQQGRNAFSQFTDGHIKRHWIIMAGPAWRNLTRLS